MINLVGLTGLAGCGKDTLAEMISNKGWVRVAYADALKDMCIDYLGLSKEDAYTQEGKVKYNEFWGMTNREILQKVGTDAMRNGFHPDVWIKIAQLKIQKLLEEGKKVIVTDARFDNEAKLIEDMGGVVVKIIRDGVTSNLSELEQKHISEKGIDEHLISFTILNDLTKEKLVNEFEIKLDEFERKHNDFYSSLFSNRMNDDRIKLMKHFILNCRKWLYYSPSFCGVTQNCNARLEWLGNSYQTGICILTDFVDNKFQIYTSGKKVNKTFDLEDIEGYYFCNNVIKENLNV